MKLLNAVLISLLIAFITGCMKPANDFNEDDAHITVEKNWSRIADQAFDIGLDLPPDPDFEIKSIRHTGKGNKSSAKIFIIAYKEKVELGTFVVGLDLEWDALGNFKPGPVKVSKKKIF